MCQRISHYRGQRRPDPTRSGSSLRSCKLTVWSLIPFADPRLHPSSAARSHGCAVPCNPYLLTDTARKKSVSGRYLYHSNLTDSAMSYRYARVTGDLPWLKNYMPTLRLAASFCFDLINPKIGLLDAPGSLMIDVFIRYDYPSYHNPRKKSPFRFLFGNSQGVMLWVLSSGTTTHQIRTQ